MTAARQPKHQPHVTRLFRSATIGFFVLTVLVAGAAGFMAFAATTITITLGTHPVRQTATVTVVPNAPSDSNQGQPSTNAPALSDDELHGLMTSFTKTGEKTAAVAGTGGQVEDYAQGTITITNHWTKPQPLAATTRLRAAANGMTYRTTKRVDVPAGGSAEVEIVATERGQNGNVGPTTFEIVALWAGLKDKIFGQSAAALSGGLRSVNSVTQVAIDEAQQQVKGDLAKAAAAEPTTVSGYVSGLPPTVTTETYLSSAKAGDQVASFTIKGTATFVRLLVNETELGAYVTNMLTRALPNGETFTDATAALTWKLISLNERLGTAQLELTMERAAMLSQDSPILKPDHFTRQNRRDILSALRGTPGVTAADVRAVPFWSSHTPSLTSQIHVVITRGQ